MEPEELGGVLLQVVGSRQAPGVTLLGLENEMFPQPPNVGPYPGESRHDLEIALAEAWAWLEGQALIVWGDSTNGRNGYRIVGRRGRKLLSKDEWACYSLASMLPKQLVHPMILKETYFNFMRGDYDTAIFQAFKAVEVAVRDAAGFGSDKIGVPLMNDAFRAEGPTLGPLTDAAQEPGERVARRNLFAGAIGSYKNNHSHRDVGTAVQETVELLLLATHLFRIVDQRRKVLGR
jgi:uncharacterized protein (TIGR02391 family)